MEKAHGYDPYEGGAPYWFLPSDRKTYDYEEYLQEKENYENERKERFIEDIIKQKKFEEKIHDCYVSIETRTKKYHSAGENINDPFKTYQVKVYRHKYNHQIIHEEKI